MKTDRTLLCLAAALLGFAACDPFLDVNPDKRAEIDTLDEVDALLGSAYTDHASIVVAEMMGDNIDDFGLTSFNRSLRFLEQVYAWEEITESNNESPENFWADHWGAVGACNYALQTLGTLGPESDPALSESYGEAYIARAYNHFMLACMFCMAYHPETGATDPGLPYLTAPEEGFNPQYGRGTLAETYARIEEDIERALPLVGDSRYTVPKYHFNVDAAYAFAARFYLFYGKYEKAIACADRVLGDHPRAVLKDWARIGALPTGTNGPSIHTLAYVDSSSPANLLLQTSYSIQGYIWLNYSTYSRFSHGSYISSTEDIQARHVWGQGGWHDGAKVYAGSMDRVIFWRVPRQFQYTDPVAGIGYNRTIYPALTTDETLLVRAEAQVLLGNYQQACDDLNLWLHNITTSTFVITPANVKSFYEGIDYYKWDQATIKKHLHPGFDIGEENGDMETMLQCVLDFKRLETMGFGQRWYDIKRYGITVYRRQIGLTEAGYVPVNVTDSLVARDPRQALQIPYKVIQGGFEPNPR